MRLHACLALARTTPTTPHLRVDGANIATSGGEPLMPPDATACAICFVRNPLDRQRAAPNVS